MELNGIHHHQIIQNQLII